MQRFQLDSTINLTLFNNRDPKRINRIASIANSEGALELKDEFRKWIEANGERPSETSRSYTDAVTLHCVKNGEYLELKVLILKFGPLSNLGKIVINYTDSYTASYETLILKFKYEIDREDKDRTISIVHKVIDIMSTMDFTSYQNEIYHLF